MEPFEKPRESDQHSGDENLNLFYKSRFKCLKGRPLPKDSWEDLFLQLSPGNPEMAELRIMLTSARTCVKTLELDRFKLDEKIESFKAHIKRAYILLMSLRKVHKLSIEKLLDVLHVEKYTQVHSRQLDIPVLNVESQSWSIEEVLIQSMLSGGTWYDLGFNKTGPLPPKKTTKQDDGACKRKWEEDEYFRPHKKLTKKLFGLGIPTFISLFIMITCVAYSLMMAFATLDKLAILQSETEYLIETTLKNCPEIFPPENGDMVCDSDYRKCDFSCNLVHLLIGQNVTNCKKNGRWDADVPECQYYPCPKVVDRDCAGLMKLDKANSNGVYLVSECDTYRKFKVYCDVRTDGGGWTAIQRRLHTNPISFERNLTEFLNYFGEAESTYWLGLINMNKLTSAQPQSLMVRISDLYYPNYQTKEAYSFYQNFSISNDSEAYRLRVSGYQFWKYGWVLEAGDSLSYSDEMQFTTMDSDRDTNLMANCAIIHSSAWWHRNCTETNLNGLYTDENTYTKKNIYWQSWRKYSPLKMVEMLIRPQDFV